MGWPDALPRSSIVVPVCNYASLTRQCLNALLRRPEPDSCVEVIVVDDGSRDLTPRLLAEYGDRIRVVTRDSSAGFATARNDGAAVATGRYLIFLNNDTIPGPDWLQELERYVDQQPRAAIVGSKLLFVNDTIEHAGVVICQDAYPRNLYVGFPADHPAVNRSRRFQAVTATCMLVKRDVFEHLGGFDTTYRDGYEDVDLCLRAGEVGHEVHYCHRSLLHRLELVSREPRPNNVAHNQALFRSRWAHRVQPDDLQYYVEDGLLQVDYPAAYPVRLTISPLLATINVEDRDRRAERLLESRAHQVFQLLQENVRLKFIADEAAPVQTQLAPPVVESPGELVPPEPLRQLVGGCFEETGHEFLQYFIELGALMPSERVLDVGCGVGRMALPLTSYLNTEGLYEGLDVAGESIEWCTQHVTTRYPNFNFQRIDVYNQFYNPEARRRASTYTFPFDDEHFDFIFLTSVFTHMLPPDVKRYISEISRVLKEGGRVLSTFFLLNAESESLIESGQSGDFAFRRTAQSYRALDPNVPEAAIAYEEALVRHMFAGANLLLIDPVRYGRWPGRPRGLSLQDIVVAVKGPRPGRVIS